MAAEETVQTLEDRDWKRGVRLLMWFNIALMKYLRRDKSEEADEKKQHSTLPVDGILTFLFSDFLTLFILFI